jgi:hypothetical protein
MTAYGTNSSFFFVRLHEPLHGKRVTKAPKLESCPAETPPPAFSETSETRGTKPASRAKPCIKPASHLYEHTLELAPQPLR